MVVSNIVQLNSSKKFDENLIPSEKLIKIQRRPSCRYMTNNKFECSICMNKSKSCNKCEYETKNFFRQNKI